MAGHAHSDRQPAAKVVDGELVAAAQAGDADALDELLRRSYPLVLRFLTGLVGDPDLANDLTQDTLLMAWQQLPSLTHSAAYVSWLYRIAHNRFVTNLRRRRLVRLVSLDWLAEGTGKRASLLDPSHVIERLLEHEDISRVLDKMTPSEREVLLLYHVVGFRSSEIVAIAGISEAAVRQRLHRAEQRFRNHGDAPSRLPALVSAHNG